MSAAIIAPLLAVMVSSGGAPTVHFGTTHSIRKGWYSMSATIPRFRGNEVADAANQDLTPSILSRMAAFRAETQRDGKPMREHEWKWGGTVSIASAELISVAGSTFWYTGGAHPNSTLEGYNYGRVAGRARRLQLADFLKQGADVGALASGWVLPKLKARGASGVVDGVVTELKPELYNNFVVTPSGITWLLSKYEVASYAEGEFEVKVPWSEMRSSLRSDNPAMRWSATATR